MQEEPEKPFTLRDLLPNHFIDHLNNLRDEHQHRNDLSSLHIQYGCDIDLDLSLFDDLPDETGDGPFTREDLKRIQNKIREAKRHDRGN